MAATRSAVLLVLLSVFVTIYSIKDGSQVDPCDYPGVVALLNPDNYLLLCTGVADKRYLFLPEICGAQVEQLLKTVSVLLYYGDGIDYIDIPVGTKGTVTKGVYTMIIPVRDETCNTAVQFYRTGMQINVNSCEVTGYGDDKLSAMTIETLVLKAASITKSTSAPCCEIIFKSLRKDEKGPLVKENVPLNCVVSSGAACGSGDLGGPVYCTNDIVGRVLVGLVATAPCKTNGMFLIHDMTGGDSLKFGISP